MTLTPSSHPRFYAALLDIAADNGALHRWAPDPIAAFDVPPAAADAVEAILGRMTSDNIDVLATGEQGDAEALIVAVPERRVADAWFNLFFDSL